jgi:hypothetical protein
MPVFFFFLEDEKVHKIEFKVHPVPLKTSDLLIGIIISWAYSRQTIPLSIPTNAVYDNKILIFFLQTCGEPAISHDSHHISLVQWTTCLLPATRDTGSNPLGGLM